ncbi:hypothetical protein RRG08_006310 [Elysia crispata]|uniref:Uncharacterized protein n=1 Tax=Elysia crispata TaxID=231223 RepID=A0AAE1D3C2_9GAST|nr:hypothetical protein RRG08_006310 [Elysia crispata]
MTSDRSPRQVAAIGEWKESSSHDRLWSLCGKGSARELNLPIVKGLVGDKTVDMLRDTGCEGVVIRRGLVEDDQLTEKCCLIVRIDNTVLLAENARIQVKTPYLYGEVETLYVILLCETRKLSASQKLLC